MKPRITFDKSASKFILNVFGKTVDKKGRVIDLKTKRIEKCGICKTALYADHFAGVVKDVGFVCDNGFCLIEIATKMN